MKKRMSLVPVLALAAGLLAVVPLAGQSANATSGLSISVSGNHFVDQNGQTVRLLGVNTPSSEYACFYGYAYGQQMADPAAVGGDAAAIASDRSTADAIAAWHATAVRVPLNQDCWLGINGMPAYGTAAGYRQAMVDYVTALNQAGIYAILDLHWSDGSNVDETTTAPANGQTFSADGQHAAPDQSSLPFWKSVATTFVNNHAVVFDLFNEPYSPAAIGRGSSQLTWACLENGGCTLPSSNQFQTVTSSTPTYVNVGFQQLINAIRSVSVTSGTSTVSPTQPIMLSGLDYANDLSQWLSHVPTDPAGQLAASFHNYYGQINDTTSAWDTMIAPIAASYPVVTGEFDQGYDCQNPPTTPASLVSYDNTWMDWADAHGVSYTAWGWWVIQPDPGTTDCSSTAWKNAGTDPSNVFAVIDNSGNPTTPDGIALHTRLAQLTQAPGAPIVTTNPANTSVKGGSTATFTAAASGTPTPAVQWQVDDGTGFADLAGQTSTTLSLPGVTSAQDGYRYRAVFTNASGSATTNAATLTVVTTAVKITVTGKQYYGQSTATFAKSGSAPLGVTLQGTVSCTEADGVPISQGTLAASSTTVKHLITGASCSGLSLKGTTAAQYRIVYVGSTFTVNRAHITITVPALITTTGTWVTFSATVTNTDANRPAELVAVSFAATTVAGTSFKCGSTSDALGNLHCSVYGKVVGTSYPTTYTASSAAAGNFLAGKGTGKFARG